MKTRLKGMASATALRLVPFSIRMALKVVAMAANAVCRREPYSCWLSGTALSVPLSFHPLSSDFHHCRTIVNAHKPRLPGSQLTSLGGAGANAFVVAVAARFFQVISVLQA